MTRYSEIAPYIIAEIGSNWQTLDQAVSSVSAAKQAGADAVKFQAFDPLSLYGFYEGDRLVGRMVGELPPNWIPALKDKADACGIDFMCTAFSPELVKAVDPYVPVHKVASSDLSYPQLLEAVARTGKPVLLSTGASTASEIAHALKTLTIYQSGEVTLLYCVAAYPALHANLDVMHLMQETFGIDVGFSDHTPGTTVPIEACRQGAMVLEKHVTAFPELDTPDRPHSLTMDEFKTMVDYIRGDRAVQISPTPEEKAMVLKHNRRLVATRDITSGEVLRYGENFGAYRSLVDDTRGMSPFAWGALEGQRSKVSLKRGQGIGPGDF